MLWLYDARRMSLSFRILGHACMLVENNGRRLLLDPWLIGSCYWRSWWHFPKPVDVTPDLFEVDAIYITHGHFDHFHYPSLRKFNRSVKILIARFVTGRLRRGVESLGFKNIVEMSHGVPYQLEGGITVCSYQHGFDDTAVVIESGGTTILNLNDSHVTGLALRQILRRYRRIDFLLRSHAPAQGYPICYTAEDPVELHFHNREDYILRFQNSIRIIQPKHAIPFASNVCHLHSETAGFNSYNITPHEVAARCHQTFGPNNPVVLMTPGDSWDSENGFRITDPEEYADSDQVLSMLSELARPALANSYKDEALVSPDFQIFRRYMTEFMGALPFGLRMIFRPVIVFDQPTATHRYWTADFSRRVVSESSELPKAVNSVIQVHPAVLMDALGKGILYFVHISKRMRIWVRKGGMKEEFKFWGLLQLYEIGYLPLRNIATPRGVFVIWHRRLEVLEMLRSSLRSGRFEEKAVPEVY
jgi:UDP-MurNAc hydroxylase